MGFRQNKRDSNDEWNQWIKQHRDLIEKSGLPDAFFANEDSWLEFIEYGCLRDDPTGWSVSELSLKQKATTLRLIWGSPLYLQAFLQTGVVRKLTFDLIENAEN